MPDYEFSLDAEADLLEIATYTIRTWGPIQARSYEAALVRSFEAIGKGTARYRRPLPHRPEIGVTRCEHHYVFFVHEESSHPLVVAVLHENMDLLARLLERIREEDP